MRAISWGLSYGSVANTSCIVFTPLHRRELLKRKINISQPWTPCDSPIMGSFWQDGDNYWGGQQPMPADRFPDTAIPTALKRHRLHPSHRNAILWCHLVIIATIEIMKWPKGLVGAKRQTAPLLPLPAQPSGSLQEIETIPEAMEPSAHPFKHVCLTLDVSILKLQLNDQHWYSNQSWDQRF